MGEGVLAESCKNTVSDRWYMKSQVYLRHSVCRGRLKSFTANSQAEHVQHMAKDVCMTRNMSHRVTILRVGGMQT